MIINNLFNIKTLAVTLAIFSSTAAMGEPTGLQDEEKEIPHGVTQQGVEQKDSLSFLDKKWVKELISRIQIHGYAQGGYSYTHRDGTNNNLFELKRVLFWVDARITDRWSFQFMHDFSSVVQEFYTDYRITKNHALTVRLGQFKNGLSLENPLSPTSLEAIDVCSEGVTFLAGCGSDPLMGKQFGRDLGISLFGETNNGKLRYELQVMNGQGINKKDGNKFKDIIARIEYRPIKGLNLVASGQIGQGHAISTSCFNPTIAVDDNYKRHRWTAGFEYRSKAINLRGEYLEGYSGSVTSRGAYVTGSVPLGTPKVEFVGSYDYFNYNTQLGYDQHKAIAGIQYWFYKKCRVQLQYVYRTAYASGNQFVQKDSHALMCQVQVRFN